MTLIPLTIDRKLWLRGEGSRYSKLLRGLDGKMCCLGFASLALGEIKETILGLGAPFALRSWENKNSAQIKAAMVVNDVDIAGYNRSAAVIISDIEPSCISEDRGTIKIDSEEQRERILTKILAKLGFSVTFVN
jgi:hypothetical protein